MVCGKSPILQSEQGKVEVSGVYDINSCLGISNNRSIALPKKLEREQKEEERGCVCVVCVCARPRCGCISFLCMCICVFLFLCLYAPTCTMMNRVGRKVLVDFEHGSHNDIRSSTLQGSVDGSTLSMFPNSRSTSSFECNN